MYLKTIAFIFLSLTVLKVKTDDKFEDFLLNNDDSEIMIAQESRRYQAHAKSPIKIYKPIGVTNSHRPQYDIDSEEDGLDALEAIEETSNAREPIKREKHFKSPKKNTSNNGDDVNKLEIIERVVNLKPKQKEDKEANEIKPITKAPVVIENYRSVNKHSNKVITKEGAIRDAVLRALERKDQVGKFAQILPIIRSMSGPQRIALASLVASQVTTPVDRRPLNLAQVRSIFGSNQNTSTDQMLPILLDTANLIGRANKPGKQTREVKPQDIPQQITRRSDTDIDDDPFETLEDITIRQANKSGKQTREVRPQDIPQITRRSDTDIDDDPFETLEDITIRRANKPGKQTREVKPQDIPQITRRSDTDIDDDPFETLEDIPIRQANKSGKQTREVRPQDMPQITRRSDTDIDDDPFETLEDTTIRQANKSGKQTREVRQDIPQITRRSDTDIDDDPFETLEDITIRRANKSGKQTREVRPQDIPQITHRSDTDIDDDPFETLEDITTTTKATTEVKTHNRVRRVRPNKTQNQTKTENIVNATVNTTENTIDTDDSKNKNATHRFSPTSSPKSSTSTTTATTSSSTTTRSTTDLAADSTQSSGNMTQESPVAEKLRTSYNRFHVDKLGNFRRGNIPKPPTGTRRATSEPTLTPMKKRPAPTTSRKQSAPEGTCELFTNSLCLQSEDYPKDAIELSIRRNKAAAGALLADFKEPADGIVDGVSAAQEAKYTPEHYLVSNRRGDTANRDFAGAGEAGFMCPSIVKYARPQRARATSGQWKYIVNTGEHTQTLRLEKCLKPKESCTYLTDNFKSKCVQVYNYHRLLTWDQQNGLHMDIFKVPTCCSCHIEGYSVNFPPVGHRAQETSSENFPSEELTPDHGNNAFETIQQSVQRPKIIKKPSFLMKPSESFPTITENHNMISNGFSSSKLADSDFDSSQIPTGPIDSYGSYYPDSFNQASSTRIVKRPGRKPGPMNHDSVTLPSYLEPPTPANPSSFSFIKETPSKYKITSSPVYKRGAPRPSRRPIRKKISGAPDDLMSAGTSIVESFTSAKMETLEDFNDDLEDPDILPTRATIAPKLQGVSTQAPALTSTTKTAEQTHEKGVAKDVGAGNKKVNYNYHPIIDFFEDGEKGSEEGAMDRDDSLSEYTPSLDSEWTPINHPVSRNNQNNLLNMKH